MAGVGGGGEHLLPPVINQRPMMEQILYDGRRSRCFSAVSHCGGEETINLLPPEETASLNVSAVVPETMLSVSHIWHVLREREARV